MSADWNDLYRAIYPDLVRYLHRKVWDEERAQELAQEAFVRAIREEPDQPRAWLFTVASNLAKDESRTVLRRRKHLTLLRGDMEQQQVESPERDLERTQRMDTVKRALDRLSERDREVLLLWDAGLNYEEIAAEAGLSVGAVGTTLARARKRLLAAHQEQEGDRVARN